MAATAETETAAANPAAAAATWPGQPSEMATERDGHWQPLIADNWQGGPSNSLFL